MTRAVLALLLLAACTSGDAVSGDDDDDTTGTTDTTTSVPACDDTSITPVVPLYENVIDPSTGTNVFLSGPPSPRVAVFVFHGSGGEAWHHRQTHPQRTWNLFNEVGFAVIAPESVDRVSKQWDHSSSPSNADFRNLSAIRDHYVAQGLMSEDTPIVAYGFSNGASFAEVFTDLALDAGWPVVAGLAISNRWSEAVVPVWFTVPEHDDVVDTVQSTFDRLEADGEDVRLTVTREHPFGRDEMVLTPPYTEQQASDVFDELVSFGLIDDEGVRLGSTDSVDGLMTAYERNSTLPGPDRVTGLVRVAWATHRTPSETACEMRDFVLDHLTR